MADNNNPIYYKDLVSPDNSIVDLIKQLDELSDAYTNALKNIKAEAVQLAAQLNKVSGATEQGRKTTRAAASDADRLTKAQRELAFAESENAQKLAELRLAQQEANQINKLVVKLNQSAEGSYNRLSAQYSLNKIYLNNMTKAEREATEEGRKLEQQTRELYEEMKRLQSATGMEQLNVGNYPQMTEAAEGYADKLKDLLGLNTEFGNSILSMGRSGGGQGFFASLSQGAKAFGATLLTLLTNPVFLAIAGIAGVGVAFKFWFDYNQGLIEATRLTQQFTGKSGDDLKAYRNEVQAIADVYDKDFKEVLQSTNAVAKQFGISQDEALTMVKDGFIAGADANGEYLETLKEYPAYFKEAGVSASQFVAITAQAGKSGIYSDKAVDTIKEGNIRIREMTKATADALTGIGLNYKQLQTDLQNGSKTTFDVMQLVSEKLNELPENSAAVGTAIADIFGGPGEDAGLQYLKTLKDIDTDLDSVKAKAGELGQLQEEQMRSQAELNNVISALFDQTGGTFEMMTTRAKTFLNDGLVWIIKGIVDVINYFIKLYNDSLAFRVIVESIIISYKNLWNVIKSLFTYMIEQIKVIGTALHGAFTLDFDEVKSAYVQWGKNTEKLIKTVYEGAKKNIEDGTKNLNRKITPITIPVAVGDQPKTTTPTGGGGTPPKKTAPIANYDKKTKDTKDDTEKKLEAIRKKNLDLQRKYEDALTELITNEFDKRRQKTQYSYQRQIEDLRHQLATEKDLTEAGKKSINGLITALEQQQTAELKKIENERQIASLEQQKAGIQLRLEAAKKGSEQEYQLRLEMIEKERQLELAQNKNKPTGEQQDEAGINAKYDTKKTGTDDEFLQLQLMRFDQLQALEQSEFDLLRNSEERKTRFKLNAEKERLKKILELNAQMGNKLSQQEVDTIKNTIAKIDQEIEQSKKDERSGDIYGLFGLNLDDDAKAAISESVNFALEQLSAVLAAKVAAADQAVQAAEKEVDASQSRLDAEIEARNNGYANNVVMAQKELDQARKNQEKAQKDKAKAVKQQQMLDTIQQTSSLITASANIWSSLSGIPIIGTGLAIAALALMWGSFAASKIKARQMTKEGGNESYGDGTVELLAGGSHQSGNDVDLGTKPNGTRRRAEGGEFFAVINKRNSRRFRRFIPDVINSLNNGTFANKYLSAYDGANGLSINVGGDSPDMEQIKNDVSTIKENGKRRFYSDANGTVEMYKNLKRRIRNN
ncbi:tail length tape-measure protein [Elizabethkingia phage TCUEAP2]|nr:tail length tape-measure protein [Elizabethkingia phage TCUEAP2]